MTGEIQTGQPSIRDAALDPDYKQHLNWRRDHGLRPISRKLFTEALRNVHPDKYRELIDAYKLREAEKRFDESVDPDDMPGNKFAYNHEHNFQRVTVK